VIERPPTTRKRLRRAVFVATMAAATAPFAAHAQTLRLRGDALVETQSSAGSPAGVMVLQGEDKVRSWLSAEGLVWAGAKPDAAADVLVLAVRARAPNGRGELRLGRFVLATGALFPVQIDGAHGILRAPTGSSFEVFGGAPVVPRFGARAYDWLAGGRVAQRVASVGAVGLSYVQRREYGEIANQELGADVAFAPAHGFDLGARGAYDLTSPGVADARLASVFRTGAWRFEAFAAEQSPGRLLPATSLFSVLGDFPSASVGTTVKWTAAPRLDLFAGGAGQSVGGGAGGNGWLRGALRLDARGEGSLGLEVRRVDVASARWTGVRAIAARPLGRGFRFSTEIEVVVPDAPDGRGIAWPWGLLALGWRSRGWEIATAVEGASTPTHRYETNVLARIARSLELP
jgi:hypothetical protein